MITEAYYPNYRCTNSRPHQLSGWVAGAKNIARDLYFSPYPRPHSDVSKIVESGSHIECNSANVTASPLEFS